MLQLTFRDLGLD